MKYMKRVSAEVEFVGGSPEEEELIVQGVRFAFRVHQVKTCLAFKSNQNCDNFTIYWWDVHALIFGSLLEDLLWKQWGHFKSWEIKPDHATYNTKTGLTRNLCAGQQLANLWQTQLQKCQQFFLVKMQRIHCKFPPCKFKVIYIFSLLMCLPVCNKIQPLLAQEAVSKYEPVSSRLLGCYILCWTY